MELKNICIFCGKDAENKTKEHIIPKWLIKLTKQAKQEFLFGPYYNFENNKKLNLDFQSFTFENFVYPACYNCNIEYSKLELSVKPVIQKILGEDNLNTKDFNLLLTWLDKVRIGLYIADLYNSKNILGIQPNFFIRQGVQTKDRMLLIYKFETNINNLIFGGTGLPAFMHYPLSFYLIINNIGFLNIADDFLLSKSFGLPYPKERYLENNKNVEVLVPGTKNINYPVIDVRYNEECTQIYQPVFNKFFRYYIQLLCPLDYYRKIFGNENSTYGEIFYKKPGTSIKKYLKEKNNDWIINTNLQLTDENINEYLYLIALRVQYKYLCQYGVETAPEIKDEINRRLRNASELIKEILKFLETLPILKNLI